MCVCILKVVYITLIDTVKAIVPQVININLSHSCYYGLKNQRVASGPFNGSLDSLDNPPPHTHTRYDSFFFFNMHLYS